MAKKSESKKGIWLILLLLLIIAGLCVYIFLSGRNKEQDTPAASQKIEENQGAYVKPEEPVDRSKNVTLPGWGGFTIPADTKEITQGFEFHNPEENLWYEDEISIDGNALEKLVVDSGNTAELNHYLKLAGSNETVADVTAYDEQCFAIEKSEDGVYTVEAIGGFEGTKTITVKTEQGSEVNIDVTCNQNTGNAELTFKLTKDETEMADNDVVKIG